MSNKEIKRGIFSSYGIFMADVLAGLIFTPFLINSLGQSEYGIYSLMGALIGTFAILDFGFGNAIIRYIAQFRAENRKDKEANFFAMCLVIYGFFSLIAIILGVGMFFFIDKFYSNLSSDELNIAKVMFVILVFNISCTLILGAFNAFIQGYEKFTIINLITVLRLIVRISVLITLLSLGFKSISVVVADTILNIAIGVAHILYSRYKLKLNIKLIHFDKKLLKELTNYSSTVFISNIAEMFFWRGGLLIIGAQIDSKAIAIYSVGITLLSYFQYISGVINGKLFPKITQMVVCGAMGEELTNFCIKVGRVQFVLLGGIVIGFLLFGLEFISLWVGSNYSLSWWVGIIMMSAMIMQSIQYPCVMILRAFKKDSIRTILQLVIIILGTLMGTLLIQKYGAIGMTLGMTIAIVLLNWIVVNILYVRMFDFKLSMFLKQILKIVPSMLLAYISGFLLNYLPGDSWSIFTFKCAIFTVIYALFVWFLGANESEKLIVRNLGRRYTGSRIFFDKA